MNILLTSVGRRSYLVDYFREALDGCGYVYGANSDPDTSAMQVVDQAFHVPLVNDPDYIPALLELCKQHQVILLVPLFDIDLPVIAANIDKFRSNGIIPVVSDPETIAIANDKWRMYKFLTEQEIPTPTTFLSLNQFRHAQEQGRISLPVIVKPRWGMGSLSMFKAHTIEEVAFFYSYCQTEIQKSYLNMLSRDKVEESVLIQECVGGKEYGLDVFNSFAGENLACIAKEKIAMRSGETDIAVTVDEPDLDHLGVRVGQTLGHIGNLDMDVLRDELTDELKVLELNARFGGGYPFSHLAGADFPRALIHMAKGEYVDPELMTAEVGVKSRKFIQPKT